ncbi:MAG: hypothetical protein U0802_13145 [Candidatus Binatia bacterium]
MPCWPRTWRRAATDHLTPPVVRLPASPPPRPALRSELGVPDDAARVLVLEPGRRTLDWDWLNTFDRYEQQVERIFATALDLQTQFHAGPRPYFYSIAEMGYLQRFVASRPDRLPALHAVGNDLRIVGGGITSPDNLLPNGETFLRDYLVGKTRVDATLGLPIRQA